MRLIALKKTSLLLIVAKKTFFHSSNLILCKANDDSGFRNF